MVKILVDNLFYVHKFLYLFNRKPLYFMNKYTESQTLLLTKCPSSGRYLKECVPKISLIPQN